MELLKLTQTSNKPKETVLLANCACGELLKDCAYPNCDFGDLCSQNKTQTKNTKWMPCADCPTPVRCSLEGCPLDPLDKLKAKLKNKLCSDCPTPEDCSRYGCQWGD